jgi:hypothetical protein
MTNHPYLRAYMAGILLPTWFLLIVLGVSLFAHTAHLIPAGLDRFVLFPMAVVPNLWGMWNLLYVALHLKERLSIGVFGALLPVILVPCGAVLAASLELRFYTLGQATVGLPIVIAIYFLAWKYGVGFFNRVVGLG